MSLRYKSEVHNHLAVSRKRYAVLTMTPASEPDATGNSLCEDDNTGDAGRERLFELAPEAPPTVSQTRKQSA